MHMLERRLMKLESSSEPSARYDRNDWDALPESGLSQKELTEILEQIWKKPSALKIWTSKELQK